MIRRGWPWAAAIATGFGLILPVWSQSLSGTLSPALAASHLQLAVEDLAEASRSFLPLHGEGEAIAPNLTRFREDLDAYAGELTLARLSIADPDQRQRLDALFDSLDDLRGDLDTRVDRVNRELGAIAVRTRSLRDALRQQAGRTEEVLRRPSPVPSSR